MRDHRGRYDDAGRGQLDLPTCPVCGGPTVTLWVDVTRPADGDGHWWRLASYGCSQHCAMSEMRARRPGILPRRGPSDRSIVDVAAVESYSG